MPPAPATHPHLRHSQHTSNRPSIHQRIATIRQPSRQVPINTPVTCTALLRLTHPVRANHIYMPQLSSSCTNHIYMPQPSRYQRCSIKISTTRYQDINDASSSYRQCSNDTYADTYPYLTIKDQWSNYEYGKRVVEMKQWLREGTRETERRVWTI